MALYPCFVGPHRHKQRNGHVYPAILNGSSTERANLRMCPSHIEELRTRLARWIVDPDSAVVSDPRSFHECLTCGRDITGEASSLFVTMYVPGQEREDYAGLVHRPCGPPSWTGLNPG